MDGETVEEDDDWDDGSGTDGDADADAEVDTNTGNCDPETHGTVWQDETTGLSWQNYASDGCVHALMDWQGAVDYCDDLIHAGYEGWRLPTISELRTLVRGCPGTAAGGECDVTDACPGPECWTSADCECSPFSGSGPGGCYWDGSLIGACSLYWSSVLSHTEESTDHYWYWTLDFSSASLRSPIGGSVRFVICVRE